MNALFLPAWYGVLWGSYNCETHGEGDTNGKAWSSPGYHFLTGGGALFKVKTLSSQPFTERKCVGSTTIAVWAHL
jgi:hypothetical protein